MTEAKTPAAKPAADTAKCRVLKKGDGKVHKGNGEKYKKGEEFEIASDIAIRLEDAGLVDLL